MNPWMDPSIAVAQRQLVDEQLQQSSPPQHFGAFVDAIRATNCPGQITEIGCASGYGREIIDRAGVEYRSYSGVDISPAAIDIAKERYPESEWWLDKTPGDGRGWPLKADIMVDGSTMLHVDDWRAHLAALCRASRRWLILHRVPCVGEGEATRQDPTHGYGTTFPAWRFSPDELLVEMKRNGFAFVNSIAADGYSVTLTFAKPRHYVTYADGAYLTRLKAIHASMVRHCGTFALHVLAWDDEVAKWCSANDIPHEHIIKFLIEHPDLRTELLPGPPRSRVEHMWTVGPRWIADCMERAGEPVTYLDADLMFHSSPEPVFAEIGAAPAAVVPHAFASAAQGLPGPTAQTHEQPFGRFNVGMVYFADLKAAQHWADRCRGWCYDRVEMLEGLPGPRVIRYGDQKYLEELEHFGAHVIQHPGAAPGPWCAHASALDVRDGVIHFGNRPLVAWHYSALKLGPHGQDQMTRPEYQLSARQEELLYAPYIAELRRQS